MKKTEKCYTNRELSWLQFNERVLNEAGNPRVPLAERMTFASIYQTNLDEFFMVRVGTLMMQMNTGGRKKFFACLTMKRLVLAKASMARMKHPSSRAVMMLSRAML